MVKSGDMKKVLMAVILVMSMTLSAFVLTDLVSEEAVASLSEKDERGYYYMTSIGDQPRTTYNWIDVKSSGTSLGFTSSGSADYGQIDLPVPIALGSTQYFTAMQNVGQVKSFVDDLIMLNRGIPPERLLF
jgi:hypothetical protein